MTATTTTASIDKHVTGKLGGSAAAEAETGLVRIAPALSFSALVTVTIAILSCLSVFLATARLRVTPR
jgi:hypothetical protein